MRVFLYSVFDSCGGIYDRPFVAQADGMALRSFGDIAADAKHPIGQHPEHYMLFRIGMFNDNTGEVESETPVCIGKAHELVAAARIIKPGALDEVLDMIPPDSEAALALRNVNGD